MEEGLNIPYGSIKQRFESHIELKHNINILFSGKYGIGKSTFLHNFFQARENDIVIRLFPVNYVVNSNENIFELIKVDIIKQLQILGEIKFTEDLQVGKIQAGISYAIQNPLQLGKHISKSLAKLHPLMEVASTSFSEINDLIKDFSKFENEFNDNLKLDHNKLITHVDDKSNEIGSYIEYNLISKIIFNTIRRIKNRGKKVTLLVDDLDRLDPEHIFRILNIFSSHQDVNSDSNKFGFNRVILVCDLENIKSIFHHKYGEKTDFEGYIDKFFSEEIFEFNNNDAIDFYLSSLQLNLPDSTKDMFIYLLRCFLNKNILTIRRLVKHKNFQKIEPFEVCSVSLRETIIELVVQFDLFVNKIWFSSDDISIIYLIKYFSIIFGSYTEFKRSLIELSNEQNKFNENLGKSFYKSFALIDRFIRFSEDETKIFFNRIHEYNHQGFEVQRDYGYPTEKIGDDYITYKLKWNAGNKYSSESSYFEGYTINSQSNFQSIPEAKFNDVRSSFLSLLTLIESKGFKQKLEITS